MYTQTGSSFRILTTSLWVSPIREIPLTCGGTTGFESPFLPCYVLNANWRNKMGLASRSSSPLKSFPQRPTGPSGSTERM